MKQRAGQSCKGLILINMASKARAVYVYGVCVCGCIGDMGMCGVCVLRVCDVCVCSGRLLGTSENC